MNNTQHLLKWHIRGKENYVIKHDAAFEVVIGDILWTSWTRQLSGWLIKHTIRVTVFFNSTFNSLAVFSTFLLESKSCISKDTFQRETEVTQIWTNITLDIYLKRNL